MTGSENVIRRRPGGRSARVRQAVLDATLELLREKGMDRFSVAEVVTRSGVNETSIYRRWGTRDRLMIDALLATGEQYIPIPDTGSLRGDLIGFAAALRVYLTDPLGRALAHALSGPTEDPVIIDARSRYFEARLGLASVIIERAVARGELPAGTDATLALEMLIGPLHFRTLMSRQPLEDGLASRLADLLINGLAAPR